MRQHMYKAWNKEERLMSKPFYLHELDAYEGEVTAVFIEHGGKHWDIAIHTNPGQKREINSILLEFTGLYDKNNTPIFEGDIVKAHFFGFDGSETDNNVVGEIVYRSDRACFVIATKTGDLLFENTTHFDEPCIEVIGNIYQDSHLLEENK